MVCPAHGPGRILGVHCLSLRGFIVQINRVIGVLMLGLLLAHGAPAGAAGRQSQTELWDTVLKQQYFQDRPISSDQAIVELRLPVRAEDSGVVPISVNAKIPQTAERYVKTVYVIIDKNPRPLAGTFHLTPEAGRADLAMRLRINEFTHVRVIAEMNNGDLHMDSGYTRASGGCSEPPPFLQLQESRKRIGEMKFRASKEGGDAAEDVALGQLIISHPNITGMQLDQRTRAFIPAEYVTKVEIRYNGTHILTAETDISISEDPSFRFFFKPKGGGSLEARMTDSKGREITRSFPVDHS